jgi:type I restriction enzyme R subunit
MRLVADMSNFAFLQRDWVSIHHSAVKAESYINSDPRAACFYSRIALEQIVDWLFRMDPSYKSWEVGLGARVHDPSFKANAGEAIFTKATVIIGIGNRAAHAKASKLDDALTAVRELFQISFWLARNYAKRERPNPALKFEQSLIPPPAVREAVPLGTLIAQQGQLLRREEENKQLQAQLEQLRKEVAEAKAANANVPDDHDYSEAQTRDYFIDLLLREAGWDLSSPLDREYEVQGMPNNKGIGYVDYVLWGADGKPLAVVEAKRTRKDPRVGQQQAKLYADCLEAKFSRRPVIYYTNGYEHHFWDDQSAPPRRVEGFHKRDELELLFQRRTSKQSLSAAVIEPKIVERTYQHQAIRGITEAIEKHNQRRSLVVMATGSGKTRTAIALVELLMRCNWAKRVLFLADRVSLVRQASKEFGKHLPDAGVVNLLNDASAQGRVYVSTYPTMLNLVNDNEGDKKRFGIGHFDLVIVDEAHRSIYAKYGSIFSFFDSYLVGLTATPKDEVDHNTYRLFELEQGVPTYAYPLDQAIADGYLVPPRAISVPMQFQRQGIKYDQLSDEEKEQWDELDWGEDGPPDAVDPAALNQWLFNESTVDQVLEHLVTQGEKVASGDRLGKSIIFAKNQLHAEYIEERFNANYPEYKGKFARIITFKTDYAQSLIEDFGVKDKDPHVAISVDMLDTGIDVPEVLNLVFFKLVRSKTKFWQMIGRGTRLCKDLYAPGVDKQFFNIFDFCQNLEFFNQNLPPAQGKVAEGLDTRLFKGRVELVQLLDAKSKVEEDPARRVEQSQLRDDATLLLHSIVSNMTLENFIVRPKRLYVERYSQLARWKSLTQEDSHEITENLANLPSQFKDSEEEAKQFDFLMLSIQLEVLTAGKSYDKLRARVIVICHLLELQDSIPAVREQMPLIQAMGADDWWADVTVGMLESSRKKLRGLIKLIEKSKRPIIYTQFEDSIGTGEEISLPVGGVGLNYERFKEKARQFLKAHETHLAVQRLKRNMPITAADLDDLESMLLAEAGGRQDLVDKAKEEASGLGLFVRSLVGLDRQAALEAMDAFLSDRAATSNQLHFLRMIVDQLTIDGAMVPERLYEAPFTGVAATGPDALFPVITVDRIIRTLNNIRNSAILAA